MSIPGLWSRELPPDLSSVRVYQDAPGYWYASLVVAREVEPSPGVDGSIGIDCGVSTTATTTDPDYDLPRLGHPKRRAAELAKAQRQMARRDVQGQAQ